VQLSQERSVLLVHDVTHGFIDGELDPGLPPVLANVRALVDAAHASELPVIFIGPSRPEIPAVIGPLPTDTVIPKPRWGAFYGTVLAEHLQASGRDTLIVCGLSLAGGVETTARDAYNRDLKSIVVADACLCRAIPDQGWGDVTSAEVGQVTLSVLAQRSTRAGAPPIARIVQTSEMCAELEQSARNA
jgi:nicotinamidase-related amidase